MRGKFPWGAWLVLIFVLLSLHWRVYILQRQQDQTAEQLLHWSKLVAQLSGTLQTTADATKQNAENDVRLANVANQNAENILTALKLIQLEDGLIRHLAESSTRNSNAIINLSSRTSESNYTRPH